MKFKTEVSLLLIALALFSAATFFYSYQGSAGGNSAQALSLAYPYRSVALAFVGFGSVSMVTASISYQKKNKALLQ